MGQCVSAPNVAHSEPVVKDTRAAEAAALADLPVLKGEEKMGPGNEPLQKREKKIIRVFISSTFEDMSAERNHFTSTIYPRVERYCREKGWEFMTVDLRWGIRDESTDDHKTTTICLDEITRCQEISPGANFVLVLGNRAGWRPLPPSIPSLEFHALLKRMQHKELFTKWYVEDQNAQPEAQFCLPPLTAETRDAFWKEVSPKLVPDLHQAAKKLRDEGRITFERFARYFASVTENEVVQGVLGAKSDHKPLVFLRDIQGFDAKAENAQKFANLTTKADGTKEVDQESWDLVVDLKSRIKKVVDPSRVFEYSTEWKGSGINTDYLEKEGLDLEKALISIIDGEIARYHEENEFEKELKLQLDFAKDTQTAFIGRAQEIETLNRAFFDGSKPAEAKDEKHTAGRVFVITGLEGNGKKTLAANRFLAFRENPKIHVCYRSMNLSADSRYFGPCLYSLYAEAVRYVKGEEAFKEAIGKVSGPTNTYEFFSMQDFSWRTGYLMETVRDFLLTVPEDKPITFIISGVTVSRLEDDVCWMEFDWLPRPLPKHINIIVSMPSIGTNVTQFANAHGMKAKEHEIKTTAKREAEPDTSVDVIRKIVDKEIEEMGEKFPTFEVVEVRLDTLPMDEAARLLTNLLKHSKRQLIKPQFDYVLQKLNTCPIPLLVEMISNHVAIWRSSDQSALKESLPGTIVDGVHLFLQRVEKYHGRVLVSRTLAAIYSSLSGITEDELKVTLGSDPEVIKDISQYHTATELPAIVWSRLFLDIVPFLRDQGGLLFLGFEALATAVYDRYLKNDERLQLKLHTLLARRYAFLAQAGENVLNWEYHQAENKSADTVTTGPDLGLNRPDKIPKTWSDDNDYKVPLRVLRALIYHMRKARQYLRCDLAFTDLLFLRSYVHNPHVKIFDFGYLAMDILVDAFVAGVKMERLEQLCQFMTTQNQQLVSQNLWPWETLTENMPESIIQSSRMLRHRGTPVCHFNMAVGNTGWYMFERRFDSNYFPQFMPSMWAEKPSNGQYGFPVSRFTFSPGPKKPLPPNLQKERFPYGNQLEQAPVPMELQQIRKLNVFGQILFMSKKRVEEIRQKKLDVEAEERKTKAKQIESINQGVSAQ